MVRIEMRQCRFDPGNYWKRWVVLQYEEIPQHDPILVGCRYFQTKGGAEAYKAKLEEAVTDADRQEA